MLTSCLIVITIIVVVAQIVRFTSSRASTDMLESFAVEEKTNAPEKAPPSPPAKSCPSKKETSFQFQGLHNMDQTKHIPNLFKKESRSCKFFPSTDDNFECPKDYPFNTGANIGFGSSEISCNGKTIKLKRAKAYAVIGDKGKIKSIQLICGGENYEKPPSVRILGNAKRKAEAYATLKKDGSVRDIVVEDPGYGYTGTPDILISKPKKTLRCNMCCRINL